MQKIIFGLKYPNFSASDLNLQIFRLSFTTKENPIGKMVGEILKDKQ